MLKKAEGLRVVVPLGSGEIEDIERQALQHPIHEIRHFVPRQVLQPVAHAVGIDAAFRGGSQERPSEFPGKCDLAEAFDLLPRRRCPAGSLKELFQHPNHAGSPTRAPVRE
jgi:hypothetical protein